MTELQILDEVDGNNDSLDGIRFEHLRNRTPRQKNRKKTPVHKYSKMEKGSTNHDGQRSPTEENTSQRLRHHVDSYLKPNQELSSNQPISKTKKQMRRHKPIAQYTHTHILPAGHR